MAPITAIVRRITVERDTPQTSGCQLDMGDMHIVGYFQMLAQIGFPEIAFLLLGAYAEQRIKHL